MQMTEERVLEIVDGEEWAQREVLKPDQEGVRCVIEEAYRSWI